MKFDNALETIGGTKANARVMARLSWSPGRTWTGREIAKAAKISQPQAQEALERLEREGFAIATRTGGRAHWKFNEKNLLAKPVTEIVRARTGACRRLAEELLKTGGKFGMLEAYVFGSFADASEKQESDIDLFVEVKKKEDVEPARRWLHKIARKFVPILGGTLISTIVLSQEESGRKKNSTILRKMRHGIKLSDFWRGYYDWLEEEADCDEDG